MFLPSTALPIMLASGARVPHAVAFAGTGSGSSGVLPLYVRRLFHAPQMDIEFALYQMLWLCKSPKAVYVFPLPRPYLSSLARAGRVTTI